MRSNKGLHLTRLSIELAGRSPCSSRPTGRMLVAQVKPKSLDRTQARRVSGAFARSSCEAEEDEDGLVHSHDVFGF
jgi:hypothetical protein